MLEPVLRELRVEVTTRCTSQCRYCYSRHFSSLHPVDLDEHVFHLRLEQALGLGAQTVSFTGGEPLAKAQTLVQWVRTARQLGLEAGLLTSGTGVLPQTADAVAAAGLSWARVSVDVAPGDHLTQALLGRNFGHASSAITLLRERGIPVVLRPTATPHMVGHIDALLRFAAEHDVERVEFQPYMPCGAAEIDREYWMPPEIHFQCLRELLAAKIAYSRSVNVIVYPGWFEFLLEEYCGDPVQPSKCGRTFLFLDASGSVKTCAMSQRSLGGLAEGEVPLRDIWYEHPYLWQLRQMSPTGICSDCERFALCCITRCPAANTIFGLAANDPTPVCPKVMLAHDHGRRPTLLPEVC